jgi:Ca2+-binding EF-hand superfamily protein
MLSPAEFYAVQKEDEPEVDQKELEEAFTDHDRDASGALSLEEWQAPFEDTVQNMLRSSDDDALDEEHSIEHYRNEFHQFDKNADSFLDESELAELADAIHESHKTEDADAPKISAAEILHAVDRNGDGKVDLEEYILDGEVREYDPSGAGGHMKAKLSYGE